MANVIAVIWDFDKTLVDGYMQNPIFKEYDVDPKEFWSEVDKLPLKYQEHGVKVNPDTIYLNHFIHYAKDGKFKGLNNKKLKEFGELQTYYNGVPEFLKEIKSMFRDDKSYTEYGIQVENYIVSTGFAEIIRGSNIFEFVEEIWGCELIETNDDEGNPIIGEIAYTIDNTTKTRAIFEINKGIPKNRGIDVNSKIPEENRRVHFKNMIYIADGPSDIPAFSLVHKFGGATFAIYPKSDEEAMKQVDQMRTDGRIDMYAEADYSKGSTAYMWIKNRIKTIAERIRNEELTKINASVSGVPKHLT